MPHRPGVPRRAMAPFLNALRAFLMRNNYPTSVRYQDEMSAPYRSSQPAPVMPAGETHKLADNYYYTRDARRQVLPPVHVAVSSTSTAALPAGASKKTKKEAKKSTASSSSSSVSEAEQLGSVRPGSVYSYSDQGNVKDC